MLEKLKKNRKQFGNFFFVNFKKFKKTLKFFKIKLNFKKLN